MVIKIIGFLMKFLNDAEVQRSLIDSAEKLAKRTTNKYDDSFVNAFKDFWQRWNENK